LRHLEIHRVGDTIDDVEAHTDVSRINNGAVRYPEFSQRRNIVRTGALGSIRQLFDESEHGAQLLVDRSCTPVNQNFMGEFVAQ
jgi:hypothetical protein